jgi:hypothetical protein
MVMGSTPPPASVGAETQRANTAWKVLLLCCAAAAAAPISTAFGSPYYGSPITIPGTIEAETFDRGGEGVGYHEMTWANDTGQLRPAEGVDIRTDYTSSGGNYIVTEFQTNEWMAYTINVTSSGVYQWGVRTATPYGGGYYYIQIDGQNMTGPVAVPNTGSLDAFRWVPARDVWLSQGQHQLKIVNALGYFDVDNIVIMQGSGSGSGPQVQPQSLSSNGSSGVEMACSFASMSECGMIEQSCRDVRRSPASRATAERR